ncbi:MAG: AAA family ATPase, partial [Aestuariivirga sp.]
MKFSRLRLSGFKSFVEPTDLLIEPGLTGVVGPNGCGKSNLLEALRWVMGESSYKSMRASGMDDVIFSGTTQRPARNMAEVVVTMENDDRSAPAQYNENETLEISRRIEREAGSAYRINGKDVRARDVQLLFADVSTGARSPALVRQGQIAEIINAKPQARRLILEEAAGITGLHTRRHEAELKLRAAEQNLTRLEDVTSQLETQLNSLKRQARQATKYKQISAEIRKLEAAGLYVAWKDAAEAATREAASLDEATRLLAEHTRAASEKLRHRDELGERLPGLREQEAIRAAVLQRVAHERNALDEEERRADQRRSELDQRMAQISA